MSTVISRCEIEKFQNIEILNKNVYRLRWGRNDESDNYCSYELSMFYGELNINSLRNIFKDSTRRPLLPEVYDILKAVNYENDDEILDFLKELKTDEINIYDKSNNVDGCFIEYNDITLPYWISKADRNDLKQAVINYKELGNENYRLDLRDQGFSLNIPCDTLLNMLATLEVYAINCFNVTSDHLFNVKNITNITDLTNYDHTLNYPEKLTFTF